jgi:small subunit ribosomal protein S3
MFYQSASLISQDIFFQPRKKTRSFRSIFSRIVKDIPLVMKKGLRGSLYVVHVDQKAQK